MCCCACLPASAAAQWLRGSQERAPLAERRQYAFDYQGLQYVDVSDNLLQPGDSFLTTCTYDSTERANRTRFGEETMVGGCGGLGGGGGAAGCV